MSIYTTYFANLRNLPKEIVPIAICAKPPKWWKGLSYSNLAPPFDVLMNYKHGGSERDYIREYNRRVLSGLNVYVVWKELSELAGGKQFALVCYEKTGEFCHRHLVAEWFFNHGYLCREYSKTKEEYAMTARGRPKKEDAKRGYVKLRIGAEEKAMLDYICEKTEMTKSEVIREALHARYNLEKTRHILW